MVSSWDNSAEVAETQRLTSGSPEDETSTSIGSPTDEATATTLTKRKRRPKVTPDGDLPLNRLNRQARYWYLIQMDFNRDDLYSKLITQVTGWTSADSDHWLEAWDLLHSWTKQWQHDMLECFRAHLVELQKTNPYLDDIQASRRLDVWKQTYDISVIAELLCFATKLVDFEKTVQKETNNAQEVHIKSVIAVYLKTFYCWVMEQVYQCAQNPDSKCQAAKLFELVRTICGVPQFSAIKVEHFCLRPVKPMKSKKLKAVATKDAFAVEARFAIIGEITPFNDPEDDETQDIDDRIMATQ